MEKTKTGFFDKLTKAVAGKSTVDVEVLDELEAMLIASDVGLDTTIKIIERIFLSKVAGKDHSKKVFSRKESQCKC